MRPGPSTEQLAGATAVGVRVASMLGGRVVAEDIPVGKATFEATTDRVVPSQVKVEASPDMVPLGWFDPLNNYGQRLQVTSLLECNGQPFEVPLGWFQITSWEESASGVDVTAVDLMNLVDENPMAWPSSPPAGATLLSELQRLCSADVAGATLPVVLDPGVADRKIPRTFEWGTSRSEAIRDLCDSYQLDYMVKADGILHVTRRRDKGAPVATYTGSDLFVEGFRRSKDRIANRWTVGGSPQGDEATKWTSVVSNFHGPYDPATYGVVNDRKEFNAATSADAVAKAAQTYMRKALDAKTSRSLQIVFDPRLELDDIISVLVSHEDGTVEPLVGRVTALSMNLSEPGALMRVDVEELSW